MPYQSFDDALEIRTWLKKNYTLDGTRRILTQLSACNNWLIQNKTLENNKFVELIATVKLPKNRQTTKSEINPFTKEERDLIINALETDKYVKP
nr:hypothetical protein BH720_07955 [Desertifilum tharense IPPAS B-1220]